MGPGRHKSENTVTICEIGAMFCVGLGVLVGTGWVEDAAELGDEGKAAGCVPPAALLSLGRVIEPGVVRVFTFVRRYPSAAAGRPVRPANLGAIESGWL
jgi:hypothetical protein